MRTTTFRWIQRGKPFKFGDKSQGPDQEGFPAILRHLVTQRGIEESQVDAFLNPQLKSLSDPFQIPEMDQAVARLLIAIDQKQEVCIYGDYDVDGISSIALMSKILEAYGLQPRTFIPKRGGEGYGLSFTAIERCMAEGAKPDLLIAVDCGTVSIDEVALLRDSGTDVIIVDHHEPAESGRPACVALVNPKTGNEFTYFCTAGLVFKLGHALLKTRSNPLDLKTLLDLAAIATVADIVPLVDENRILVRHGLRILEKSINPGLRALKEKTGITGRPTAMDVGFRIGPRINAAGRMDFPEHALAILQTDDEHEAHQLADRLDEHNKQRQKHEGLIRDEAAKQLSEEFAPETDPVIVIGSRKWHHGVVGIVASRLMRQYYKPTFVIAIDENGVGKGSGRGIDGVSLVEAIRACDQDLIAGGGHAMAAGISINEESINSFRQNLGEFVIENSTEEDRLPRLIYDVEVDFAQLSLNFLASYELLQPFGNSNPQPVFISRNVELSRPIYRMKNHHLRLSLRQEYHEQDAVYFGGGEYELPEPPWDIAFTIDRNTFRGKTSLQIIIKDIAAQGSR